VSECRFAASAEGWVVSGALVLATAARAYADGVRLQQGHPAARLDLSGIDAIDSAGVAVLLAWLAAARQRGESFYDFAFRTSAGYRDYFRDLAPLAAAREDAFSAEADQSWREHEAIESAAQAPFREYLADYFAD